MATRSFIALDSGRKIIPYRYHHWDGYILGVGASLIKAFKTPENVRYLFKFNKNIETLIESQKEHLSGERKYKRKLKKDPNSVDIFQVMNYCGYYQTVFLNGQTIRFLKKTQQKVKKQKTTLANILKDCDESYIYLYKVKLKKWFVSIGKRDFVSLEDLVFFYCLFNQVETIHEADYKKYAIKQYGMIGAELNINERSKNQNKIQIMYKDNIRTKKIILEFLNKNKSKSLRVYENLLSMDKVEKETIYEIVESFKLGSEHIKFNYIDTFLSYAEQLKIKKLIHKTQKNAKTEVKSNISKKL